MKVRDLRRVGRIGVQGAAIAGGIAFAGAIGAGNALADEAPPAPQGPMSVVQDAYDNAPSNIKKVVDDGLSAAQSQGINAPDLSGTSAPQQVQPVAPTAAVAQTTVADGAQNAPAEVVPQQQAPTPGTNAPAQNGPTVPSDPNAGQGEGNTEETGKAKDVPLAEISPDLDNLATSRSLPELVDKYVPGGGDWLKSSGTLDTINGALGGAVENGKNTQVDALPENHLADGIHEQVKTAVSPYVCGKDECSEAIADFAVNATNGGIDDLIQLVRDPMGWVNRHAQLTTKGIGGAAAGAQEFVDDPALWTADRFNELYNPDAAIYDMIRGVGGEPLAYAAYAFAERNLPYMTSQPGQEFNWPKMVLWGAALAPAVAGITLGTIAGLIVAIPVALAVGVGTGLAAGAAVFAIGIALGPVLPAPLTWTALMPWAIGIGIAAGVAAGAVTFVVVGGTVAAPFIITSVIASAILATVTQRVPWYIEGTESIWHAPKGTCPEDGAPTLINPGATAPLTPEQRIVPKVNTWVQVLGDIPGFFGRALTDPNAPASPL